MFLFISGWIFSQKKMSIQVMVKQFLKILIPYYIVALSTYCIWGGYTNSFSIIDVFKIIILKGYGDCKGLYHLWFLSYILLAYIITPLIQEIMDYLSRTNILKLIIGICIVMISLFIFFELYTSHYYAAWMICYVIGIVLGSLINNNDKLRSLGNVIMRCIYVLSITLNLSQIVIDYLLNMEFIGVYASIYERFCNYSHVLLGITLVMIFRYIYFKFFKNNNIISRMLRCSDKYSYYIYLVHQIFILGTFSICGIIENKILAIFLTLTVILLLSVLIQRISYIINNKMLCIIENK